MLSVRTAPGAGEPGAERWAGRPRGSCTCVRELAGVGMEAGGTIRTGLLGAWPCGSGRDVRPSAQCEAPPGPGHTLLVWAGAPRTHRGGLLCPAASPHAFPLPPPLSPAKAGCPWGWPHLFAGGGQLVRLRGQHHQVVDDALQVGDLPQHGQLAVLTGQ